MKSKQLTEDEKEFIVKNIHQYSMKAIADMLGRSTGPIRAFVYKNGLKGDRRFNKKALQNPYFLTEQEFECWKLISRGLTDEEILKMLYITRSTFKTHLTKVYEKLGLGGIYKKNSSIYRVKALLLWQKAVKEGLIEE